MKILSWNILFSSRNLDAAYAFIEASGAEIICLQEVPEPFLMRLSMLPYKIVSAPEVDRIFRGKRSTEYVAILSRYPVLAEGSFPLPSPEPHEPLRTRIVSKMMNLFNMWARGCGNRHGVFADIETSYGNVIRVVCAHLSLTYPERRAHELKLVLASFHETYPNVLAGDFNVLETRRISILNWLLGGRASDALLPARERLYMEEQFARAGLQNPLKGMRTHPLSASQLDHILVPQSVRVKDVKVVEERYGSDHNPVCIEVH